METVRKRPLWRPKLRAFLDDFRGTIKICLDLRTSPPAPLRETRRKFACSKIVGTYVMGSRNLDPHPPQSRPSTWHVYMGGGVVYFHGVGGGCPRPQDRPWVRPTRNPSETESGARLPRGAGWCCGHRKTQPPAWCRKPTESGPWEGFKRFLENCFKNKWHKSNKA